MREKLGNRRVTGAEQYYTPNLLALSLVELTLGKIQNWQSKIFIEPAGGTGSFIEALKTKGISSIISVDTEPLHAEVQKANFLEFDPGVKDAVTISNPPFGRNNALSVPFFNRAANFSSHIAFLVPRSWRKWSVINRLDRRFHLIHDVDVSVIYQSAKGEDIALRNELRTCFQIWERRDSHRKKITIPDPGLLIRSNPEEADVAIRVFGYGCGTVYREFERKPNTTMMYLRTANPDVVALLEGLDYERFAQKTAYTEAVSLQEINFLLNEKLFGDGFRPEATA